MCCATQRDDRAGIGHVDRSADTARTTRSANADRVIAVIALAEGTGRGKADTTITAAATDGLRVHTNRLVTQGQDGRIRVDGHRATGVSSTARAADRDVEAVGIGPRAAGSRTGQEGAERVFIDTNHAALAAATTDRLSEDRVRGLARRLDNTVRRDRDRTSSAAVAGITTDGQVQRVGVGARQGQIAGIAALSAATANGFCKHAVSGCARGRDHAGLADRDRTTGTTNTATAPDRDVERVGVGQRERTGEGRAAITAAAADGLRENAVGSIANGADIRRRGDRDAVAVAATRTAAANGDTERGRLGRGQRTGERS